MGPILIFDKSFLESLNLDESVFLDMLFLVNIVPIFYVETLADLEKTSKAGKIPRAAEEIVEEIAKKTPVFHTRPNVHHQRLVVSNLLGREVDMSKRGIISGGKYTKTLDGKIRVNFKEAPEADALARWKRNEFLEVERNFARQWRQTLSDLSFDSLTGEAMKILPQDKRISSMEDIKQFLDEFVKSKYSQFIYLALTMLNVSEKARQPILKRWRGTRFMPFHEFAPYAAYVLKINLFFYLCLGKGFLSPNHKKKPTNIIDLSYLYYLPFCMVFVSNDNFQKRIAPLFMEHGQSFVNGDELKEGLKKHAEYYQQFSEEIKKQGLLSLVSHPPKEIDSVVGEVYDKHLIPRANKPKPDLKPKQDKKLMKHLKNLEKESVPYTGPPISSDDVDSMTFSTMVPVQRGSWRLLPERIEKKKPQDSV